MKKTLLLLIAFFSIIYLSQSQSTYYSSEKIINKIKSYKEKNEFDKIVSYLDGINKNDSLYKSTLITKSYYLIQQKKYEESIKVLDEGLKQKSINGRHSLYLNKAINYWGLEEYEKALETFDDGLKEFPKSYIYYYNKGSIYMDTDDFESALEMLKIAAIINPFYPKTYLKLGNICYQNGLTTQALLSFNIYLMLNPEGDDAFAVLNSLDKLLKKGNINDKNSNLQVSSNDLVFEEIDLVLESKASLDSEYKFDNEINIAYVRQNHLLFQFLETINLEDDFWGNRILRIHKWILNNHQFENFIYTTTYSIKNEKYSKIVKKHKDDVIDFIRSFKTEWKSIMQYNSQIRNGVKETLYFDYNDSALNGIGKYKDNKPFGFWEFFTSEGKILSKGSFDESGKKTGVWTWYFSNGNIEETANYENGNLIGDNIGYFKNNKINYKASYQNDNLNGRYEGYNENRALSEVKFFKNGEIDSLYTSYYPNTNLSKEYLINYNEGKPEGEVIQYYANGEIQYKVNYISGVKQGVEKSFFANGKLSVENEIVDAQLNGFYKSYFSNGNIYQEGDYFNGEKIGMWKLYFSNGKLKSEFFYEKGVLDGEYKEYTENGNLYYLFNYRKGELIAYKYFDEKGRVLNEGKKKGGDFHFKGRHVNGSISAEGLYDVEGGKEGNWKFYSTNGKLTQKSFYKNNLSQGDIENYYENGQLENKVNYTNNSIDGYYNSYFINAEKSCEGWYKNDKLSKEWKCHYKNGTLKSINFYHKDKFHGTQIEFSADGKKQRETVYEYDKLLSETTYKVSGDILNHLDYTPTDEEFVVELKHSNNKVSSKTTYKYGVQNGKYEAFDFYGNKTVEGNYNNGLQEGKWYYYDNNVVTSEASFILGKVDGVVYSYYKTGKLKGEDNYILGERYGKSISYAEDGETITVSTDYIENQNNGKMEFYSEKGNLQLIRFYSYDRLIGYSYLDTDGKEIAMIPIKNETAKIISYYKNGQVSREMEFVNGYFENDYNVYYEDAKLFSEKKFKYGDEFGNSITYYPNGKIKEETTYTNDEMNGVQKKYYNNGNLKEEINFINNIRSGDTKYYNEEGKLVKIEKYFNGEIYEVNE